MLFFNDDVSREQIECLEIVCADSCRLNAFVRAALLKSFDRVSKKVLELYFCQPNPSFNITICSP